MIGADEPIDAPVPSGKTVSSVVLDVPCGSARTDHTHLNGTQFDPTDKTFP